MLTLVLALCVGISIGFISAIPVGPVGIMCIQRSVARGRRAGFIAGSGAVFGDAFFAGVAAFGIAPIIFFFHHHSTLIGTVGALLVILVGSAGIVASKKHKDIMSVLHEIPEAFSHIEAPAHSPLHNVIRTVKRSAHRMHRTLEKTIFDDFITSFFITVTNPITALSFFVMFGGIAAQATEYPFWFATLLTLGAGIGSLLWWFTLSHLAAIFAKRLKPRHISYLNTITSSIVIIIGLVILFGLLRKMFF